jgi:hypothetical protein
MLYILFNRGQTGREAIWLQTVYILNDNGISQLNGSYGFCQNRCVPT